jgi:hypothetical protein
VYAKISPSFAVAISFQMEIRSRAEGDDVLFEAGKFCMCVCVCIEILHQVLTENPKYPINV